MTDKQPPNDGTTDGPGPDDTAPSGSRWEQASAEQPTPETPATTSVDGADAAAVQDAENTVAAEAAVATPEKKRRFSWLGTKAALIGGAVALALMTGLGGFALGHAVSDGDDHRGDRMGGRGWHHEHDEGERMPGMQRGERPDFGQERDQSEDSTQG